MSEGRGLLIEREAPMAQLAQALARADAGVGQTVLLEGEAGIGKSALVDCFLRGPAAGSRVLMGGCDALSTPRHLGPLYDMAQGLGPRVARALQGDAHPSLIFPAFLSALDEPRKTTVVVIEDTHWADPATLDLMTFLGRRIGKSRVLLLLTCRNDAWHDTRALKILLGELPPACTQRVTLAPLSVEGVAAMAPGDPRGADALHRLAGGNPFFVTALLARPADRIPDSVRDAVSARARALSAEACAMSELASVVPGLCELALLRTAWSGPTDPAAPLDECIRSGVLQWADNAVRFRHELARQAVEESLPPIRRHSLHAAVLDALAQDTTAPAARLLHHALGAGRINAVLRLTPLAARHATRLGAHRQALAHYAAALPYAQQAAPTERAEILEGWAIASSAVAWPDEPACAAMDQAAALWRASGETERIGGALRRLATMYRANWRIARADRCVDEAIDLLETLPPSRALAQAYSQRAIFHMGASNTAAALHWGHKALVLARAVGCEQAHAAALAAVGAVRLRAGDSAGIGLLQQAAAGAAGAGDIATLVTAHVALCESLVRQWRLREAEQHCAQALPLFTEMPQVQHFFTGLLAQCAVQRGQLKDGRARTSPVLESLAGPPQVMHWSLLLADGLARSRLGEASGRATLARCFELSLAVGLPHYVLPAGCAMAETLALAGREDDARAALLQAWSRRGHDDSPWTLGLAAVWAQRLKTELPQEPGRPVAQVADVFQRELHGDYAAAAALWRASDAPFEEGLCLMHCGDDGLRQALDIFSRIGAQPAARLARAEARRRGVKGMKRGPYAAARRNDMQFTARELQVLGLLAEGRSNAQIAATLSRSERTVEHHVARLLAKAGADNRRSLLAMASRSGVLAARSGA